MAGSVHETQPIVDRIRRAAGQLGGVAGMVEAGRRPDEILAQTAAVASAIVSVEKMIVDRYVLTRLAEAVDAPAERQREIVEELSRYYTPRS